MLHLVVATVALALGGDADLQITQPKGTFGHLGAHRPKAKGILPGDRFYYSFGIKNLTFNDQNQSMYSVGVEIRDEQDKILFEQKPFNSIAQNYFGGKTITSSSYLDIPLDAKPGVVTWKVTIEDRLAKKSVVTTGKGNILPAGFGIVRVGTFADPAGQVPVAAVGVVGQHVYLNFALVGFSRVDKRPDVNIELRILDEEGKATFQKPIMARVKEDVPETLRMLPLQFPLTLDKPGRFTLQVTCRCLHGNSSAQLSVPITILPLE